MMKYIAVAVLTVIAFILMHWKKKYCVRIFAAFILTMVMLSIAYNVKVASLVVPFYRPFNQTFYQTDFLKQGEYPDSFLTLLFKNRIVYTKDDRMTIDESVAEGKNWLYAYYHNENAINFMELSGATVIPDTALNDTMVDGEGKKDFQDLGYANDMFRYSFLCNDFFEELGNYFTYYWYYSDYLPEIHVYLNTTDTQKYGNIFNADELVVLWDGSPENEAENLYIMTKAYYEGEVSKWK